MELNDRTSSYREATTTPSAEPADGAAAVEETLADTVVEVKTGRTNVSISSPPSDVYKMPSPRTTNDQEIVSSSVPCGVAAIAVRIFAQRCAHNRHHARNHAMLPGYRRLCDLLRAVAVTVERLTSVFLFLSSHSFFFWFILHSPFPPLFLKNLARRLHKRRLPTAMSMHRGRFTQQWHWNSTVGLAASTFWKATFLKLSPFYA